MFWNTEPEKPSETNPLIISSLPSNIHDWTCANWVNYYKALKAAYGKDKAQSVFLVDTNKIGFWDSAQNCKYDCDFVNYFKGEGMAVGNLVSKVYCTTTTSIYNTLDAVQNVTEAAKKTTSLATPIVIGALILGGFIIYNQYGKVKR